MMLTVTMRSPMCLEIRSKASPISMGNLYEINESFSSLIEEFFGTVMTLHGFTQVVTPLSVVLGELSSPFYHNINQRSEDVDLRDEPIYLHARPCFNKDTRTRLYLKIEK
jgi:hypothetical protein